ncbi:leucine-rich repeat protein, partial [Citrobacter youngae]|uniref:leucine-rich repeat protein n=1 Tax=Citrobacter youngae TaxID=133448 RepID=UPI001954B7D3
VIGSSIALAMGSGCDFKEITIPEGVTVIGDEAFATCESLEYVSLPDSMETLHNGLFSGCLE